MAAPTRYDGEHDIRYEVSVYANAQLVQRSFVLDLDDCTEIGGYRTTNFEECVTSCPDYMDDGDKSTQGRYENGLDSAGRQICKCSSTPKTYTWSLGTLVTGTYVCIPFALCTEKGFVDITGDLCLPNEDAKT